MHAAAPPPPSPALQAKAARVRLLITDVDGVWTDGRLYYAPGPDGDPVESKAVTAVDGQGYRWWHAAGHASGVISGRAAPGIAFRAEMLGVSWIVQDRLDKVEPWEEMVAAAGVAEDEVCYVGDDLPDAPLLRRAGLAVAVANARPEVKALADYVTLVPGGQGAVREVIELLLRSRGEWEAVLAKYESSG